MSPATAMARKPTWISRWKKLGLSRANEECPELQGIHELEKDGNYALVLEFDSPHGALFHLGRKAGKKSPGSLAPTCAPNWNNRLRIRST